MSSRSDLITSQGQGRATLNLNSVIDATYRRRSSSFADIHIRHIGGELRSTTCDAVQLRLHPWTPIRRIDHLPDDVDHVQSHVFSLNNSHEQSVSSDISQPILSSTTVVF